MAVVVRGKARRVGERRGRKAKGESCRRKEGDEEGGREEDVFIPS